MVAPLVGVGSRSGFSYKPTCTLYISVPVCVGGSLCMEVPVEKNISISF